MNDFPRRFTPVAALAVLILLPLATLAQSGHATLVGTITDATGASIPNATVTLTSEQTEAQFTASTNSAGLYSIRELAPGSYRLAIEATGFRRVQQTGVVLEADQTRRLNTAMEIGDTGQTITVSAEVPAVNTETSSRGEVIVQRQVEQLPLNGRNFTDLALLVPGIYRRPSDDDQGEGVATSGMRTDTANFLLDGTLNRSDRNGSVGVNTSLDSIQEFSVTTSTYSAEFGRSGGAQINVISKAGSNQLHGSLFEYVRNDMFDANNFFTAPGDSKKLRRNQFGASVGGPIIKDRTFFFGSYEGTRERRSKSALNTAPSADWLRGDFRNVRAAGKDGIWGNADDTNRIINPFTRAEFATPNVIPESLWSPVSKQIVGFVPASNIGGTLEGYAAQGNSESNRNQWLGKIDHRFSGANNFSARYARQASTGFDPFPSARNFYPGFGRDTDTKYNSLAFSDTHILSPSMVNEARFGTYYQDNKNLGQNRGQDWNQKFGIPGLQTTKDTQGWPAVRIDGYSEFGDRPNDPFLYTIRNYQFVNVLSITKGNHSIKGGYDGIRARYSEADVRNVRGDFRFRGRNTNPSGSTSSGFRSFADFLLGLPDATQRQIGADPANLIGWQHSFFVQDDWRPTSRLTLNIGLRYELQMPLYEENNRLASFVPGLAAVVQSGDAGFPRSLVSTDTSNWGPRLGFAYRPFGNSSTVIRGGAGIYYNLETFNVMRQQLAVTYPFIVREQYSRVSSNPAALTFSNPFPEDRRAVQGLNTPFGMDLNYKTPSVYMYNLTFEHEIVSDLALEVGYVGSQGRHLGQRYNINEPLPYGISSTGTLLSARPYFQYGDIQYQDSGASSNYNALQSSLRRRMKGGLTLLASYTFSRAIDTASSTNNSTTGAQKFAQDIRNFNLERGLSDFHRKHQFSGSFNYDLPFGKGRAFLNDNGIVTALFGRWRLNGIVTLLSGRPYTPKFSSPDVSDQRPDIVGDPNSGIPTGLWFNPGAFAKPVVAPTHITSFGNAGRNILIGPTYKDVDLSVHREFQLAERMKLQFRAEAFNVLNHPNFQVPQFLLDSSNVGQVTQTANEGREMQFALRLQF